MADRSACSWTSTPPRLGQAPALNSVRVCRCAGQRGFTGRRRLRTEGRCASPVDPSAIASRRAPRSAAVCSPPPLAAPAILNFLLQVAVREGEGVATRRDATCLRNQSRIYLLMYNFIRAIRRPTIPPFRRPRTPPYSSKKCLGKCASTAATRGPRHRIQMICRSSTRYAAALAWPRAADAAKDSYASDCSAASASRSSPKRSSTMRVGGNSSCHTPCR